MGPLEETETRQMVAV